MARRADPRSARRAEHLEELAALRARVERGGGSAAGHRPRRGRCHREARPGRRSGLHPGGRRSTLSHDGRDDGRRRAQPHHRRRHSLRQRALCRADRLRSRPDPRRVDRGLCRAARRRPLRRSPAPRRRRHGPRASSIAPRRRRVVPRPAGVARPGWRGPSDHRRDRHRTGGGADRHRHRRAGPQGGANSHGRDRRRRAAHAPRGAARAGARPAALGRGSERRLDRPGRSEAAHRHGEQGVHGHHRHQRGEGYRHALRAGDRLLPGARTPSTTGSAKPRLATTPGRFSSPGA